MRVGDLLVEEIERGDGGSTCGFHGPCLAGGPDLGRRLGDGQDGLRAVGWDRGVGGVVGWGRASECVRMGFCVCRVGNWANLIGGAPLGETALLVSARCGYIVLCLRPSSSSSSPPPLVNQISPSATSSIVDP